MNNDEMKKKIEDILYDNIRWAPYYFISRGIVYEDDLKKIADALISAGIGDVKEAERKLFVFKNELASVIHRAEVAEMAFDIAADLVMSQEIDEEDYEDIICEWNGKRGKSNYSFTIDDLKEYILEQAEKELVEEGK